MNKITRETHPEIFELLPDLTATYSKQDHRRGATFYVKEVYNLDGADIPEELRGFWETNQYIWSDEYCDDNAIRELRRVERIEEMRIVEVWKPLTDTGRE